MLGKTGRGSVMAFLVGLALTFPGGGVAAAPEKKDASKDVKAKEGPKEKLAKKVNEVELDRMPLPEALTYVSERWQVKIKLDKDAFTNRGIQIHVQPVELKKQKNVSGEDVLNKLLDQVEGKYRVDKDKFVVIPK